MRKVTHDEIVALNPCWLHDGREAELRGRVGRGITLLGIATAKDVPVADRRWLLTHLAARTESGRLALIRWAAGCAADVLHLLDGDTYDAAACATAQAVAYTEGAATVEDCRDAAANAHAYAHAAAARAARAAAHAAAFAADAAAYAAAYAAAAAAYADADADAAAAAAYAYADAAAAAAYAYAYAATYTANVEQQLLNLVAELEAV